MELKLQELTVPKPFERTEHLFWADPYIAGQLLAAHLSQATDAASRKELVIAGTVALIEQKFPKRRETAIIDFGCGPGLYCHKLAQAGYRVTGVDISSNSIAYAKEQAKRAGHPIDYHQANYLESLPVHDKFDLALLIYCDYGALGPVERQKLLQNIYQVLNAGGSLLLDVFSDQEFAGLAEEQTWATSDGGFWSADAYLEIQRIKKYPHHLLLNQEVILTATTQKAYHIWTQYFSREMLVTELQTAGFQVESVYADTCGQTDVADSATLAVLARK